MAKILFLSNGFPIPSETFVINSTVSALEHGYQVSICPEFVMPAESSSMLPIIKRYELMSMVDSGVGISDSFLKRLLASFIYALNSGCISGLVRSLNPFLFGKFGLGFRLFLNATRVGKDKNFDLVHAHFGPNGLIAVLAKNIGLHNAPIVTSFHGYDLFLEMYSNAELNRYYSPLFRMGDAFIVNGAYLYDRLVEIGCPPAKIRVIPIGIDLDFFRPTDVSLRMQAGLRIVSVGRLIECKGHKYGILAIKELIKQGVNVNYIIIGAGPLMADLQQLVVELSLSNVVKFSGALDQEQVREKLHQSDLFLMTSVEDDNGRCESQGLVTVEAQACGLPVVAFENGGIPATVDPKKSGFLVPDKDYLMMSKKILELTDRAVYNCFAMRAREFVSINFDKQKRDKQVIEVYCELLKAER